MADDEVKIKGFRNSAGFGKRIEYWIIGRMSPGGRYTTPDNEENFYFYNLREGDYDLAVDEKSLPEYGLTDKPDRVSVSVCLGQQPQAVSFQFEVHTPAKPVRKVLLKAAGG
jgi:hypothetical protein